jgi:hypothetical protein
MEKSRKSGMNTPDPQPGKEDVLSDLGADDALLLVQDLEGDQPALAHHLSTSLQ